MEETKARQGVNLVKRREPAGAQRRYDEWILEVNNEIVLRERFYVDHVILTSDYCKLARKALKRFEQKVKEL